MMLNSLFNIKKIKYKILDEIFTNSLQGVQELTCYISLDTILSGMYGYKPDIILDDLSNNLPNTISANIINIIAHYRHYFWSRHGVPSTYYIYYSFDLATIPISLCPTYRESYYEKRRGLSKILEYQSINSYVEDNLNLINIITEYLPNIYFINTKGAEPSSFVQLMLKNNPPSSTHRSLILTTNKIEYQYCMNPYTTVLQLKGDESKFITENNLIYSLFTSNTDSTIRKTYNELIPSDYYTIILALTGYSKYNLKGIKGMGILKTVKKLNALLSKNKIPNLKFYSTLDYILQHIPYISEESDYELINNNYTILNMKLLVEYISPAEYISFRTQINNKSDNLSLMDINNKYYQDTPLMLIELMEGEE